MDEGSNKTGRAFRSVFTGDPAAQDQPYGTTIWFDTLFLRGVVIPPESSKAPADLRKPVTVDSNACKGALLGVCIDTDGEMNLIGTAFVIGPGVALTAAHVVHDVTDRLSSGDARAICIAFRDDALMLWELSSISFDREQDIAFLSIAACSEFPSNNTYYKFGLTTVVPKAGDKIKLIGYRKERLLARDDPSCKFSAIADVFMSEGTVTNFYPYGRDHVVAPFACIELDCSVFSGMSGGVAIDDRGLVVGVVSTSFEANDGRGPAYVSWVVSLFRCSFPMEWPPGEGRETTLLSEATVVPESARRIFIDNPSGTLNADGSVRIRP